MAVLEWKQKPVDNASKVPVITNWTPIIGYMLERTTSIASFFYYQLVLSVQLNDVSGDFIAKIRQRRNGYSDDVANNKARAFFDVREIVNTQLVDTIEDQNNTTIPFQSIHTLGANELSAKIFSVNGDKNFGLTQIGTFYVVGYENYSTAANASPADVTTNAINYTSRFLQASLPLFTPRSTSASAEYIQSDAFNVFNMNSNSDRFLSDIGKNLNKTAQEIQYINYVQDTDYHTLAFLNDTTYYASDAHNFLIKYYDSANAQIGSTQTVINNTTNGGEAPNGTITPALSLLYFGCGPANLQAQTATTGAKPSNFANWQYYTVQAFDSGSSAAKSAIYTFYKQNGSCKGFKVRRLAWRNSVGGYDYWNFNMKSTQTLSVERNNYNALVGTYNKSVWRYNDTDRGKTTRQTTAMLKETLNTDWLSENEASLMEKLLMSTNVYILDNADTDFTQGVMITDSNIVRKTQANDKLIQYTINIEYANPVNTNS
jgi:hypothetical protein|tara:strand:- start:3479 stop:4939 length:1461 start_codon:yes stop_codon:yes gene_type:complete